MEVLQGQVSVFDFLGDIKKEVVQEERKASKKKRSTNNLNIVGQINAFDLVQDHKEIGVEFTKKQFDILEKLMRETDWIEYSLYVGGNVLFIEKKRY